MKSQYSFRGYSLCPKLFVPKYLDPRNSRTLYSSIFDTQAAQTSEYTDYETSGRATTEALNEVSKGTETDMKWRIWRQPAAKLEQ